MGHVNLTLQLLAQKEEAAVELSGEYAHLRDIVLGLIINAVAGARGLVVVLKIQILNLYLVKMIMIVEVTTSAMEN